MTILINGDKHEASDGLTVLGLLHSLDLDPAQVAVELDGLILKKPEWPTRVLTGGARLEIVQFVGGG